MEKTIEKFNVSCAGKAQAVANGLIPSKAALRAPIIPFYPLKNIGHYRTAI
ncbi:MAG TPA: hypothetical protein PKV48_06140 [Thermodesulfobacteriota bacterium]|nr:hypothetical protein [Thermodesulfobacteriota bacterium]